MTEGRSPKELEENTTSASATKQRKKRKWDQPAECLLSAGVTIPRPLHLGMGGIPGISFPGAIPLSGALSIPASYASASQLLQSPSVSQNATAMAHKLNLPKIQDELIAREIVINDAEPTVRYKLTRRQTQDEIQKSTGAVVITRGKYHPPNGVSDNEKPLYLHISAGAHLKDTAERIKAVDRAASMVEEILKQGQNSVAASSPYNLVSGNGQVIQLLSTCVFLGFDTDPSLNIAARIRGPNDQYINHIMNETGATVVLRGRGSAIGCSRDDEIQQSLHLYLSCFNQRSLEDARILAENLMDTICAECGATRNSSCKVYGAVPPPHQLMAGVESTAKVVDTNVSSVAGFSTVSSNCVPAVVLQPEGLPSYLTPQSNTVNYSYPSVTGGTCYNGYGGIYPQATPLQQVALALRQAPTLTTSALASTTSPSIISSKTSSSSSTEIDKKPPHKRKFQELPIASKGLTALNQNLRHEEFLKPGCDDSGVRNIASAMPPPKKLVGHHISNCMPPPPPPPFRNMPPPATNGMLPPLTLTNISESHLPPKGNSVMKSSAEHVSDTLLKLVEYGEEDEEDTDVDPSEEVSRNNPSKPFWAV